MSLNTVIWTLPTYQKTPKAWEDLTTSNRTVTAYIMRESDTYTKPYIAGKNHTAPSLC